MKIQEFCTITHSTKKKIHFYIAQGLLTPYQHKENGYYEFNNKDVEKLQLVNQLRNLDLSIQEIKECLLYPTLTNYFLHRHVHGLKQEIEQKLLKLSHIYYYIDHIPPNATPFSIMECEPPKESATKTSSFIQSLFPEIDARMIAIILLAPFLHGEVDDYQHFLWDKISDELSTQLGDTLYIYQRLIYQLSAKEIIETTTAAYFKFQQLMNNPNDNYIEEEIINYCKQLSEDITLIEIWNNLYQPLFKPTLILFQSPVMRYISKYCPTFKPSMERLRIILMHVSNKLINSSIIAKLNDSLSGNFTLNQNNQLDLFMIFYFTNSIYTQLPIKLLKEKVL